MRVYKRNKTYSFDFVVKENGKRKKYSIGGYKEEIDALIQLKKAYNDYLKGEYNPLKYKPKNKELYSGNLTEICNKYLIYKKQNVKLSSYNTELQAINKIVEEIGNKEIFEINNNDFLQEFINNNPIYKIKALNSILNYAVDILEMIPKNKLKKFKTSKQNKLKNKVLPKDKLKKLFNTQKKSFNLVCKLLYYSGIRKGELLALKKEDITFLNDKIILDINKNYYKGVITTTKTIKSNRKVDIPIFLLEELQNHIKQCKSDMLFSEKDLYITKEIKNIIPDFSFHMLRHTHTTQLITDNIPINIVKHRLGHSNINTTLNIYTHLLTEKNNISSMIKEII